MSKDSKFIDLAHSLSADTPTWDGVSGFKLDITTDYKDYLAPNLFRVQKIICNAGIGTHMDAPAHVIEGGRTIDQLKLEELIVDCVVIDVSKAADENYQAMPEVIEKFEKKHGEIPKFSLIIFYTGWSKLWNTPKKYQNNHKIPSIHPSTAEILLKKNIVGVGIDTLSSDTGPDSYPVHHLILGANKYLVENIANADQLPPVGAKVFVMPPKITGATEAPIRLIGMI